MNITARRDVEEISPAERLRRLLYVQLQQSGGDPSQLLDLLETMVRERVWETAGQTFAWFVSIPFDEGGLGWSVETAKTVLRLRHRHEALDPATAERMTWLRREVEDLLTPSADAHGGDRRSRRREQDDIVPLKSVQRGNARDSTLARLKRDRPDLAEQVLNGNLSANQAAIEAGFRQRTATFYPDDLSRTAATLRRHFSSEQLTELVTLLA